MDIFSLILMSIGLAMDASAVSIAKGMCLKSEDIKKYAIILAIVFGGFQGVMPIIGYFAATNFSTYIEAFDHWIAFALLLFIGMNMIKEAYEEKSEECDLAISFKDLMVLGIATSIDALAVGVSLAFLDANIWQASIIIGVITFSLSMICVFMGKKLGGIFQKYAELAGGVILIFIGIKILVEHLFF